MSKLAVLCVAATLALAGCNSLPDIAEERGISVTDLSGRIQCQLKLTVEDIGVRYSDLKLKERWAARYTLTLKVQRILDGTVGGLDWVIPSSLQSLRIGGRAERSDDITRTIKYSYEMKLSELDDLSCPESTSEQLAKIQRDAGLFQPLYELAAAQSDKTVVGTGKDFSYSAIFLVDAEARVGPSFGVHNFSISLSAEARRKDTHTLDISFHELPPSKKAPAKKPAPKKPADKALPPAVSDRLDQNIFRLQIERLQININNNTGN